MKELTSQQQALLEHYHWACVNWQAGSAADFDRDAQIYANALDTCLAAGFDPFHHPQPQ